MKVAICSDIHDNLVNLEKFLTWCKNNSVDQIICVGDVTNADTLEYIANEFKGNIFLIRGNLEIYEEKETKKHSNIKYYGRFGIAEIAGKKVGLCHEPSFINELLKQDKCNFIFYGHTHKPWLEDRKGTLIINPGTLGAVFQRASFSVWDTETNKIDLKLLELI